jgi:hypothetical protein
MENFDSPNHSIILTQTEGWDNYTGFHFFSRQQKQSKAGAPLAPGLSINMVPVDGFKHILTLALGINSFLSPSDAQFVYVLLFFALGFNSFRPSFAEYLAMRWFSSPWSSGVSNGSASNPSTRPVRPSRLFRLLPHPQPLPPNMASFLVVLSLASTFLDSDSPCRLGSSHCPGYTRPGNSNRASWFNGYNYYNDHRKKEKNLINN